MCHRPCHIAIASSASLITTSRSAFHVCYGAVSIPALAMCLQVLAFVESRNAGATTVPLSGLVKDLAKLADGASPSCFLFVTQLAHVADAMSLQGRGSACRYTVAAIMLHFGEHYLPQLVRDQQQLIRSTRGAKLGLDNTYRSGASLAGLLHRKMQQFKASVQTVTAEHGLILATVLVPNDGQEWERATLCALHGVEPADAPWHAELHAIVSLGGPLAVFPRDICTDYVARNINLWASVADQIVEACLARDMEILIPAGARA